MKKAEAISILAASVRPREAKDMARYDEAVRMAIDAICKACSMVEDYHKCDYYPETSILLCDELVALRALPSVQPERIWHSCKTPPKHHKDVLVRGTEAIGNVTIYKVMQWDVDAWRPTDYAPSIIWEEWSEIYE